VTVPDLLQLRPAGDHRYQAPFEARAERARDVVYGGQILAQLLLACDLERAPSKRVQSVHVIFSRPATHAEPVLFDVETTQDGRTFASQTVTCRQRDAVTACGLVLSTVDEPDLIRHTMLDLPPVPGPVDDSEDADARLFPGSLKSEVTPPDGPAAREPAQHLWTRYPPGAESMAVHQAVLAWATDGYMIGAALRPHAGYHEGLAHHSVSTGVVTHTISFHEPFDSAQWMLLANTAVWAGRGRSYGRCDVFSRAGQLIANCTQDAMIRPMDPSHAPGQTSKRL